MFKAGVFAKKKRREKQYKLQLTQQQLLQDRLVRDQLLEAAASKEREFVRLSGEVAKGEVADTECTWAQRAPQTTTRRPAISPVGMKVCRFKLRPVPV